MCIALPGRVIEVGPDGTVKVGYGKEVREAHTFLMKPKVGDYVRVFQKQVVEIISEKRALEIIKLMRG